MEILQILSNTFSNLAKAVVEIAEVGLSEIDDMRSKTLERVDSIKWELDKALETSAYFEEHNAKLKLRVFELEEEVAKLKQD